MHECQIIRKIISDCESSDRAVEAFKNWQIPTQDIGVAVHFDDDQIKDRDYQECHDTTLRWLSDWTHFKPSQTRQMVTPLLRTTPVGITDSKYQQ